MTSTLASVILGLSTGKGGEAPDELGIKLAPYIRQQQYSDTKSNNLAYFARVYESSGRWNDAAGLWVQATEARQVAPDESHHYAIRGGLCLAMAHRRQSHWSEALELYAGAWETVKVTLGEENPETSAVVSFALSRIPARLKATLETGPARLPI
jgi:hypothetical protein